MKTLINAILTQNLRAIVRNNHTHHALDRPNPRNHARSRHILSLINPISRQSTKLQERSPRIDQRRNAIPHQHLSPLDMLLSRLLRPAQRSLLVQLRDLLRQFTQRGGIFLEAVAVFVDGGLEDGDLGGLLGTGICCYAALLL